MTMLSWPSALPLPFEGAFAPFVRSLSGGQSLSGFEQVQPLPGHDRWQATFALHLNTHARILALRNLLTRLRGRANSLLLPAFDAGRAPLSAASTPTPIGTLVINPPWQRAVTSPGVPLGSVTVNPPFWRHWPAFAAMPYEYTALAAVTGTLTILADDLVRFVSTGDAPTAGIFVTVASAKREILSVAAADSGLILKLAPVIAVAPPVTTFQAVALVGDALITAADRFTLSASPAPLEGDRVTLFGVERTVIDVTGIGPWQCAFAPPVTLGSVTPGSFAATVNADADLNDVEIDIALTAGVAPTPGHLFSIGNRMHAVDTVAQIAPTGYRLGIWPWLRADVTAGTAVNFTAPACEVRLATDQEGIDALRALRLGKYGDVTLSFDEVS